MEEKMQRAGELHTCCIAEAKRVLWACIQALRFCPPVRETDTRTDTHTHTDTQTDRPRYICTLTSHVCTRCTQCGHIIITIINWLYSARSRSFRGTGSMQSCSVTRSLSSQHVHSNVAVYTGVRKPQFNFVYYERALNTVYSRARL